MAATLGPSPVRPDARLVYATTDCELEAFVEIDRGTEGAPIFAAKIAAYVAFYRSGAWQGALSVWPVTRSCAVGASCFRRLTMVLSLVLSASVNLAESKWK